MDNGFGGSRGGAAITGMVPHHVAGFDGRDYVAYSNSRDSHPTYHIDVFGVVTGIVHPNRRPYSTANGVDAFAVTAEIDNIGGGPDWPVSELALNSLAIIMRHHADESPRRGKPIELNDPNREQAGFWVGTHDQYVATACPGNFVRANLPRVISAANAGITIPSQPQPVPPAPNGKLVVDGDWGPNTTRALQRRLGVGVDGGFGPITTRALQKLLGVAADGIFGPISKRALQRHLGVTQDGIVGPITVRAMQTRLNAGTF